MRLTVSLNQPSLCHFEDRRSVFLFFFGVCSFYSFFFQAAVTILKAGVSYHNLCLVYADEGRGVDRITCAVSKKSYEQSEDNLSTERKTVY